MVKHRRKKSRSMNQRSGFQAIPFTAQLALSTLGDAVVLKGTVLSGNFGRDFFAISCEGYWSLRGGTAGEGPITVGYAHDDLAVGEIAENLVAEPLDPDDIIAQERSRRPVRKSGKFPGLATNESLNDGKKIRNRLRFSIGSGHALAFWAQNNSGAALTGGQVIDIDGVLYGRWVR